jgi:Holliday junction resolvasome RuvABC endonuclease subunit
MLENGRIEAVYFEEVRRHLGVDAAHVYGGFLAILSEECERRRTPYAGIPIQTIKKHATGKGNADKAAMIKAAATRWPGAVILDDNTADALCLLSLVLSGGA